MFVIIVSHFIILFPLPHLLSTQEATGSVLVSREPNKVILYRGWTEGENPGDKNQEDNDDTTKSSKGEKGGALSPELMEAIRVECGFHLSKEE
jgi:hypothetical protein